MDDYFQEDFKIRSSFERQKEKLNYLNQINEILEKKYDIR